MLVPLHASNERVDALVEYVSFTRNVKVVPEELEPVRMEPPRKPQNSEQVCLSNIIAYSQQGDSLRGFFFVSRFVVVSGEEIHGGSYYRRSQETLPSNQLKR